MPKGLVHRAAGITPAYAGKRKARTRTLHRSKDHPRVCGEKLVLLICSCHALGSPPHMRGKVLGTGKGCDGVGITPAYAGKSFRAYAMIWQEWGSPPHMRGKGKVLDARQRTGGITPAYAGKRCSKACRCSDLWDHPRICGEKSHRRFSRCIPVGSPPHMRGKGTLSADLISFSGITPAYAGKRVKVRLIVAFH